MPMGVPPPDIGENLLTIKSIFNLNIKDDTEKSASELCKFPHSNGMFKI